MTIRELIDKLSEFGDHLKVAVLVDEDRGIRKYVEPSMDTEEDNGVMILVLRVEEAMIE